MGRFSGWLGLILAALALSVGGSGQAMAGVVMTLVPETADHTLNHLTVGQTVTIDLVVSGLAANNWIFSARLALPLQSAMFAVTTPTAGPIVPAHGFSTGGYVGSSWTSVVSLYTVSPSGSNGITHNGIFATFGLTAKQPGSGTFTPNVTGIAVTGVIPHRTPVAITSGGSLSFSVASTPPPPTVSAPEPSTIVLAAAALPIALGYWRKRVRGRASRRA
jgi:hypothetical protein